MEINKYQEEARKTAMYPNAGNDFIYPALGLVGEAGEIANKLKKVIRDDEVTNVMDMSNEKRQEIAKELGDVLWYIAQLSSEMGYDLEYIAQANIDKLASRAERGKLGGSGDNR
jgi:NTP pyrophosphatase (non-canonical NTP hydrolase)